MAQNNGSRPPRRDEEKRDGLKFSDVVGVMDVLLIIFGFFMLLLFGAALNNGRGHH